MFFMRCSKTPSSIASFFIPSNWLAAGNSEWCFSEEKCTEFQIFMFKCPAFLSISCLWSAKIAPDVVPSAPVRTVPSCGFPCKCSVSWNLGWWIVDKSTWEGWGVCSQNFMMKKMPEENCAFNNWEGWVGHEVSLAWRASVLVLDGRVCPGQFPPESTWGSCRTLLEGKNCFCVVFSEYPLMAAWYFSELGRCFAQGVVPQGLLGNQGFHWGNSKAFLVPLKVVHSYFVWSFCCFSVRLYFSIIVWFGEISICSNLCEKFYVHILNSDHGWFWRESRNARFSTELMKLLIC